MSGPGNPFSVEVGIGDGRESQRLQVVDLLCSVGKRCSGEVVDVSETGVGIKYVGSKRYQIGETVGLAMRRHDVLLLVRGKVIWERQLEFNERLAGFQFDSLSDDDMKTLRELMRRGDDPVSVQKTA